MTYFDASTELPERIGKVAADVMTALLVLSVVLLVAGNMV
jgi:hypothetical protein